LISVAGLPGTEQREKLIAVLLNYRFEKTARCMNKSITQDTE
jgi:hypothetical protein